MNDESKDEGARASASSALNYLHGYFNIILRIERINFFHEECIIKAFLAYRGLRSLRASLFYFPLVLHRSDYQTIGRCYRTFFSNFLPLRKFPIAVKHCFRFSSRIYATLKKSTCLKVPRYKSQTKNDHVYELCRIIELFIVVLGKKLQK